VATVQPSPAHSAAQPSGVLSGAAHLFANKDKDTVSGGWCVRGPGRRIAAVCAGLAQYYGWKITYLLPGFAM
jgi:hypothetical protein